MRSSAILLTTCVVLGFGCSAKDGRAPESRARHTAAASADTASYEEAVSSAQRTARMLRSAEREPTAVLPAPPAENPAQLPPPEAPTYGSAASPGRVNSPYIPAVPPSPETPGEPIPAGPPPVASAPPEELPLYAPAGEEPMQITRGIGPKRMILSDDPSAPEVAVPEEPAPGEFRLPPAAAFTLRAEVGGDLPPEPLLVDEPSFDRSTLGSIEPESAGPHGGERPALIRMGLVATAAERMGDKPSETVEVFYATDRRADNAQAEAAGVILERFAPACISALFTSLLVGLALQLNSKALWALTGVGIMFTGGFTYSASSATQAHARNLAKEGPRYGKERGEFQIGVCRVSIPRVHDVGKLEAPSILRLEVHEDEKKHVVLQSVAKLDAKEYYGRMADRVANSERRELFVFIHGYNVTFEDAARRTAQMHFDLDFQGAPIFYSWPSQGALLEYTIDETNVAWTAPHFKQFLLDVVAQSGAKSINVIAHSMGNRALSAAVKDISVELDQERKLFNQVVLAAPDIDAEIFQRDIVPAMRATSEKVTLYASSNDQALIASKLVHGYPRAGESGDNMMIIPNIDTIDVSSVQTNFVGHTYYGDSDVILADVCLLLTESLPPQQRTWLVPAYRNDVMYWVFQGAKAVSHMPRTMRR